MEKLRILGQNIHFDLAEMEMVKYLMHGGICTEQQAIEEVIGYKREQAVYYERLGNFDLAEHLLKSIDEWDDDKAEAYKAGRELMEEGKLIVPDSVKPRWNPPQRPEE